MLDYKVLTADFIFLFVGYFFFFSTQEELQCKLYNISFEQVNKAYRDQNNVPCLTKRSKLWIRQMCYVAAKSNIDTKPFVDRLKNIFGEHEISCLDVVMAKSVQRANTVSYILGKFLVDCCPFILSKR